MLLLLLREQCGSRGGPRRRAGAADNVRRVAPIRHSQSSHRAPQVHAQRSQECHEPQSVNRARAAHKERKCADTIDTVPVSRAGHVQC